MNNWDEGCSFRRDVVLRHTRDGDDVRWLGAVRRADGSILVEGQDLGPAVVTCFGVSEYEWAYVVTGVLDAVRVLGGQPTDDPLAVMQRWSAAHQGLDPYGALKEAGVQVTWASSRRGD